MKLGLRGKEELRALLNFIEPDIFFLKSLIKKMGFVFVKGNGLFFTGGTIVRKRTLNAVNPFATNKFLQTGKVNRMKI